MKQPSTVRRFVVGTGPQCDIRVSHDPHVSTRHIELFYFDHMSIVGVKDLGSLNGTFVTRAGSEDRVRVRLEMILRPGDRLHLGSDTCMPWEQFRLKPGEVDLQVDRYLPRWQAI